VQRAGYKSFLSNTGAVQLRIKKNVDTQGYVMRHAGFHINPAAQDAWLDCMRKAVDGMEMKTEHREKLWRYLEGAAHHMVNALD